MATVHAAAGARPRATSRHIRRAHSRDRRAVDIVTLNAQLETLYATLCAEFDTHPRGTKSITVVRLLAIMEAVHLMWVGCDTGLLMVKDTARRYKLHELHIRRCFNVFIRPSRTRLLHAIDAWETIDRVLKRYRIIQRARD